MATLSEDWFQQVASGIQIGSLESGALQALRHIVDVHLRNILQQAHKFQRRSKSALLKVEDINSALAYDRIEILHGLGYSGSNTTRSAKKGASDPKLLNLVEFTKRIIPKVPQAPNLVLHWLVVGGCQPIVAENPSRIDEAWENSEVVLLPKEMQSLFARVSGIIASGGEAPNVFQAVLEVFESDTGLQELLPHFCQFFYHKIKKNMKATSMLLRIVKATKALIRNAHLNVEYHLQQLLPALFSCAIGAKVSPPELESAEETFGLRLAAVNVIHLCCLKYSATFPDLQNRVCQTYLEVLCSSNLPTTAPLNTGSVFGVISGLASLGPSIMESVLFPHLEELFRLLDDDRKKDPVGRMFCLWAVVVAVGNYVAHCAAHTLKLASKRETAHRVGDRKSRFCRSSPPVSVPLVPRHDKRSVALPSQIDDFIEQLTPFYCVHAAESCLEIFGLL